MERWVEGRMNGRMDERKDRWMEDGWEVRWVEEEMERRMMGTPLVGQRLRICLPMPRTWVQSLVRELRSYMSQGN